MARGVPPASPPPAGPADVAARRLLWRCRRGMKELDVLLERYAARELPRASPEERALLAQLVALPDPVLADYLLAGAAPTPAHAPLKRLIERIRGDVG